MYIRLNNSFDVRNEKGCSFIIHRTRVLPDGYNGFPVIMVPPFVGFVLAEIGKSEIAESIRRIASGLGVSEESVDTFINNLRKENYKKFQLSEEEAIVFPDNLLVESDVCDDRMFIASDDFDPLSDFEIHRPQIPLSLNLMVTTNCTTDCIYCYAQRNLHKRSMSKEEICEFLRQSKDIGVVNIALTGGDIFAMNGWKEILRELKSLNYDSFLSTKTPLNTSDIKELKEIGFDQLQFSLDSVDVMTLKKMLSVDENYLCRVRQMFEDCSGLNIKVQIRTVLTKHNSSPHSVENLYNFLREFSCISEWDVTPAFISGSKTNYKAYEVSNSDLVEMYKFRDNIKSDFPISLNKIVDDGYKLQRCATTSEYVESNQICLANSFVLSVLATGDCTVCEMLYENPEYLLGNVLSASLKDIWNSKRALELYDPDQSKICKSSPCSSCKDFHMCRKDIETRVCYSDIAKIYGDNSFGKPDPRCPLAEKVNVIL